MTYDAENRVISVDNGATATYTYDAIGRRVQATTASGTFAYIYDQAGRVEAEYQNGVGWTRAEVYAGGRHLATYGSGVNGSTYFDHQDWLGTARVRSNVAGGAAETCTSLPFGDGQNCTGSGGDPSPVHFTGQEQDTTGLDHFWFRQYSPTLSLWTSPDPAGMGAVDPSNPQTWNRYAYSTNNPATLIDPLGLCDNPTIWETGSLDADGNPIYGLRCDDPQGAARPCDELGTCGGHLRDPLSGFGPGGPPLVAGGFGGGQGGGGCGKLCPDLAHKAANNDSPAKAFVKTLFSLQPQIDAWNKGYYSCLAKETAGGATAPVVTHFAGIAATKATESGASTIAGAYYHFTDGRFTAWGKYSEVLVPNLAPKIAAAAKVLDVAGWAYFDYELANAISECSEVLQ